MSDRRRRRHHHWGESDTVMTSAFLIALGRWLARHHNDPNAVVTLPTGTAGAQEHGAVLRGLERAVMERRVQKAVVQNR